MQDNEDWRLAMDHDHLAGVVLLRARYSVPAHTPLWDHDHCEFCFAKFMEGDHPDVLHEGYCTEDRYCWICENCFGDFRERFGWTLYPGE